MFLSCMSYRDRTPDDPLARVKERGSPTYPSSEERDAWEQKNQLEYYSEKPLLATDRNYRTQNTSLAPLQPPRTFEEPPRTFEQRMEDIIAPSVNMLALKIISVRENERLRIFEWVNARLKLQLGI